MKNYLKKNHLSIITLVIAISIGLLPYILKQTQNSEISIYPLRGFEIKDFWEMDNSTELIIGKVKTNIKQVKVSHYWIENSSDKNIEIHDFISPLEISNKSDNILLIGDCPKVTKNACNITGSSSIENAYKLWKKKETSWQLKPLFLGKNESICIAIIQKIDKDKSTIPFSFGGRIKNGIIKEYKNINDYANEKATFLDNILAVEVRISGIEPFYILYIIMLISYSLVKIYTIRGHLNDLSSKNIATLTILTLVSVSSSVSILQLASMPQNSHPFVYVSLLILFITLALAFSKNKNTEH